MLIAIAIVARDWGSVFTAGLTIASLVYGPMLGAFLLGVLTTRANQAGVMTGIAVSLGCMLLGQELHARSRGPGTCWSARSSA